MAAPLASAVSASWRDEQDWLIRFYAPRAWALIWTSEQAALAFALLQDAPANGLSAANYRVEPQPGAGFDVALTQAMLRYLNDLHVGQVRSPYQRHQSDPFDPVELLRAALQRNQLGAAVDAAQPATGLYRRTKQLLAHYQKLAQRAHQPLPPLPGRTLTVGMSYSGALQLQQHLIRLGDMDASASPDAIYTAQLATAVKRFQARHGLLPDGVIGKTTFAALNVPLQWRVQQLVLTLERLRWLPLTPTEPFILVDLPGYRLLAFDGRKSKPLDMPVIVGTAGSNATPLLIANLERLEFQPYWNVPFSIARDEIIPELERNPAYLAQQNMELVPLHTDGPPVRTLDAATLTALRAGSYRIRQRPGAGNAMGAVKFLMPNSSNIYLHSTSAPRLFKRQRRDLSHGCIRVARPFELAQFVLDGQAPWDAANIRGALKSGPTQTVWLDRQMPVVLFYATALPDHDGNARFSPDVYRRDRALLEQLCQGQSCA